MSSLEQIAGLVIANHEKIKALIRIAEATTERLGRIEGRLDRIEGRLNLIGDSVVNLEGLLLKQSDHVYSAANPKPLSIVHTGKVVTTGKE